MKEAAKAIALNLLVAVCFVTIGAKSTAQAQGAPAADYDKKYTLAGLTVLGAEYTDAQAVKLFSALQIGQELTIPGE